MGLPKRFSNKRPALKTLIRRVLRGSEGRGPRALASERRDTRGPVAKNPAKSQTRLVSERRAELVADYEAGMPVRVIGAKYGVHRGTIPTLVLRAGSSLRKPGLSEEGRSRAASLYVDGITLQEVAEQLAVDDKTVREAVVTEGGEIRPRGRWAKVTQQAQFQPPRIAALPDGPALNSELAQPNRSMQANRGGADRQFRHGIGCSV